MATDNNGNRDIIKVTECGSSFKIKVDQEAFTKLGLAMDDSTAATRDFSILAALALVMVPGIFNYANTSGESVFDTCRDIYVALLEMISHQTTDEISDEERSNIEDHICMEKYPLISLFYDEDGELGIKVNSHVMDIDEAECPDHDIIHLTDCAIVTMCDALAAFVATEINEGVDAADIINFLLTTLSDAISVNIPGIHVRLLNPSDIMPGSQQQNRKKSDAMPS